MPQNYTTTAHVLLSGADYLDSVVTDLVTQEGQMRAHADATTIEQVRQGYVEFADVLHHCADTLRSKSAELRAGHNP